jgi:hypothetical protein
MATSTISVCRVVNPSKRCFSIRSRLRGLGSMWYKEMLAVQRALIAFVIVVALISAFNAWGPSESGGIMLSQALEASCLFAIVLALVIGTSLGRELGTIARSALLRPMSRERYAWSVFAVDLLALAVAYIAASAAITGFLEIAHGFAPMDFSGVTPTTAVIFPLVAICAFYGVTAVCAVMTRGALGGAILLGPICLALWIGAAVYVWGAAPLLRILCLVNPAMYFAAAINAIERQAHPELASPALRGDFYASLSVGADTAILFCIAAATLLFTAFLWRRAEA